MSTQHTVNIHFSCDGQNCHKYRDNLIHWKLDLPDPWLVKKNPISFPVWRKAYLRVSFPSLFLSMAVDLNSNPKALVFSWELN